MAAMLFPPNLPQTPPLPPGEGWGEGKPSAKTSTQKKRGDLAASP